MTNYNKGKSIKFNQTKIPPPPKQFIKSKTTEDHKLKIKSFDDFMAISNFIEYAKKDKIIDKKEIEKLSIYLVDYMKDRQKFKKALSDILDINK